MPTKPLFKEYTKYFVIEESAALNRLIIYPKKNYYCKELDTIVNRYFSSYCDSYSKNKEYYYDAFYRMTNVEYRVVKEYKELARKKQRELNRMHKILMIVK